MKVKLSADEWHRFKIFVVALFFIFCLDSCTKKNSDLAGSSNQVTQPQSGATPSPGTTPDEATVASDKSIEKLVAKGKELYASKACLGCHSLSGGATVGPSFKGLFGSDVQLIGGVKVQANEDYLRESILNSDAKVVQGFTKGIMPSFSGQLTDEEVKALIEFIKSVK